MYFRSHHIWAFAPAKQVYLCITQMQHLTLCFVNLFLLKDNLYGGTIWGTEPIAVITELGLSYAVKMAVIMKLVHMETETLPLCPYHYLCVLLSDCLSACLPLCLPCATSDCLERGDIERLWETETRQLSTNVIVSLFTLFLSCLLPKRDERQLTNDLQIIKSQ